MLYPKFIPKSIIEVLNSLENDEDKRYSWKLTRKQESLSLTVSCKLPAKTPNKASKLLQQVDSNPYLGLTISEDLQWKTHITSITKKANSSLGFLRRNLKYCSEDCKRLAYIALVRSILECGAVVWDPYQSRDIIAVEKYKDKQQGLLKMIINQDLKDASRQC